MGLYVEVNDKERWLIQNGSSYNNFSPIPFSEIPKESFAVCLVDNGMFFAAAVAFDEDEYEAFKNPDGRPKKWFYVEKKYLEKVCPSYEYYVK